MTLFMMTKLGLVKVTCNKQVMYTIIRLEFELKEAFYQIKTCIEHGMTAFITHFEQERTRIISELNELLSHLRNNVHTLTLSRTHC